MANTHLGVPPQDLILLEVVGVSNSPDPKEKFAYFRNKYEDGSREGSGTFGYNPPKGRAMVITEVDWQYASGGPNQAVLFRVNLVWNSNSPTITQEQRVFESSIQLNSSGEGGTTTAVTTGFIVAHGVKIEIDFVGGGASGLLQHSLMRGYLIDWKI